jgi:hypothetical protein
MRARPVVLAVACVLILGWSSNGAEARPAGRSPSGAGPAVPSPSGPGSGCVPAWTAMRTPDLGTRGNYLNDVDIVSPGDAWAVGNYFDTTRQAERTLIQHFDGTGWSIVPSPSRGPGDNLLFGVDALAPGDVWAVGAWTAPGNYLKTLALHWDGHAWSIVPTPTPGPVGYGHLEGVAMVAADDGWAVGSAEASIDITHTLALHWDGHAWTAVRSPNAGQLPNGLGSVAAAGPNDVWAVGSWFGSGDVYRTLALHWDGGGWRIVPTPNVRGGQQDNSLSGVAVLGHGGAWAVGSHGVETLAERWDGRRWRVVPTPTPGTHHNAGLSDVAAVSPSQAWAVGSYVSDAPRLATLVERWDGSSWEVVSSPNVGSSDNELLAVAATPAHQLAVGDHFAPAVPGEPQRTLVLRRCG